MTPRPGRGGAPPAARPPRPARTRRPDPAVANVRPRPESVGRELEQRHRHRCQRAGCVRGIELGDAQRDVAVVGEPLGVLALVAAWAADACRTSTPGCGPSPTPSYSRPEKSSVCTSTARTMPSSVTDRAPRRIPFNDPVLRWRTAPRCYGDRATPTCQPRTSSRRRSRRGRRRPSARASRRPPCTCIGP